MVQGESVLLSEGGVLVSSARFVAGGVTYALANVTSVRLLSEPKGAGALIIGGLAVVAGALFAIAGGLGGVGVFGACVAVVGVGACVMWVRAKDRFVVVVASSGAEVHAVITTDVGHAQRVTAALNQAIVSRR